MDGVLADFYPQFLKMEFEETGNRIPTESLYGKLEMEAFPNAHKHVRTPGFFRNATTIEGSIEGLKYLNDKYKVLVVSSATEFPQSLTEKVEWLHEFYPFISWQQIILCGKKDSIKGDIMIDDHPKNLDYFTGKRIIFSQPHNVYMNHESYQRVDNWKEIMSIL